MLQPLPPMSNASTSHAIAYRGLMGESWSGRGQTPAWLRTLESEGKSRSEYESGSPPIEQGGTTSPTLTEQLAAINLYTDTSQNVVHQLPVDTVHESPFNPRTNYTESDTAEMVESAKAVGIATPVLVRMRADGSHELVFGHRRLRAAKVAGLSFIPAIVRDLTDSQSAQLQAVENTQRINLDPIDEGLGYAAWIKSHGISKDELVRQTGKSRTHIYNRLKLATLGEEGQKALRAGQIKSEVATLIARVPSVKHQAQALKMILDNSNPDYSGELMPHRKARDMLAEKFTLDLKGVIWMLDDADLVDSAGACTVCPKRSGVDPIIYKDLLGDDARRYQPGATGENVCTDPMCFDVKKTAQLKRNQGELEASGKTVIAGNKARQAIGALGEVKGGYVALKDVKAALKKFSGKDADVAKPQVMTIQNPRDGKTVEVVKLADLTAAGITVEEKKPSNNYNYEAQRLAEKKATNKQNAVSAELFRLVHEKAATTPRSTLDMQLIAKALWSAVDHPAKPHLAKLFGETESSIMEKISTMSPDELGLFMLDCVISDNIESYGPSYKPEQLYVAAMHYGIDLETVKQSLGITAAQAAKPAKAKKATKAEEQANAAAEADGGDDQDEQEQGYEAQNEEADA